MIKSGFRENKHRILSSGKTETVVSQDEPLLVVGFPSLMHPVISVFSKKSNTLMC